VKHETPKQPHARKSTVTAENVLNLAFMHTDLWTRFRGDEQAQRDHYDKLLVGSQMQDEDLRLRATGDGRHTPLFNTPYDQDHEPEAIVQDLVDRADLPGIADLAAYRAKRLLESTDTDPAGHSGTA